MLPPSSTAACTSSAEPRSVLSLTCSETGVFEQVCEGVFGLRSGLGVEALVRLAAFQDLGVKLNQLRPAADHAVHHLREGVQGRRHASRHSKLGIDIAGN